MCKDGIILFGFFVFEEKKIDVFSLCVVLVGESNVVCEIWLDGEFVIVYVWINDVVNGGMGWVILVC